MVLVPAHIGSAVFLLIDGGRTRAILIRLLSVLEIMLDTVSIFLLTLSIAFSSVGENHENVDQLKVKTGWGSKAMSNSYGTRLICVKQKEATKKLPACFRTVG